MVDVHTRWLLMSAVVHKTLVRFYQTLCQIHDKSVVTLANPCAPLCLRLRLKLDLGLDVGAGALRLTRNELASSSS